MGGRVVGPGLACQLVDLFLNTEFEGGRHQRRKMCIRDRSATAWRPCSWHTSLISDGQQVQHGVGGAAQSQMCIRDRDKIADAVKAGVEMAGGTPILIPSIGV